MANRSISFTTITLSITTLAATYLLTKSLSKFGLSGTIRYIWEGDHLSPEIRDEMDKIDSIQSQTRIQKKRLAKISVSIDVAKLNSVDEILEEDDGDDDFSGAGTKKSKSDENESGRETGETTYKRHYILSQIPALSKDLGMLSYNLDKLAAQVDSVQSHGDEDVKAKKKDLSRSLVDMMGICDRFMKQCGLDSSS